jgi:hypothetical protein
VVLCSISDICVILDLIVILLLHLTFAVQNKFHMRLSRMLKVSCLVRFHTLEVIKLEYKYDGSGGSVFNDCF